MEAQHFCWCSTVQYGKIMNVFWHLVVWVYHDIKFFPYYQCHCKNTLFRVNYDRFVAKVTKNRQNLAAHAHPEVISPATVDPPLRRFDTTPTLTKTADTKLVNPYSVITDPSQGVYNSLSDLSQHDLCPTNETQESRLRSVDLNLKKGVSTSLHGWKIGALSVSPLLWMCFFTAYETDVLRESGMVFGRVMYKASTSRVTICPLIPWHVLARIF